MARSYLSSSVDISRKMLSDFIAYNKVVLSQTAIGLRIPSKWKVVGIFSGCFVGYCVLYHTRYRLVGWIYRTGKSLLDWITNPFVIRFGVKRRSLFQNRFHLRESRQVPGHSHPQAASIRSGASWSIDDYLNSTGRTIWTLSYGTRDPPRGQRLFYMSRDYVQEYSDQPLRKTDAIKMVDVDFHVDDMNHWLSYGLPVVMYTFVPVTAGGPIPDANFSLEDNNVIFKVNGGATYRHQIWNYNHDYITVDTLFGVFVYAIDQMVTSDPTRRVIQLAPQAWVPFPFSVFVPRNPLQRQQYSFGNWNVVKHLDVGGEGFVSMSRRGAGYCVTLKESLLEAIKVRHGYSKTNRNMSDIERFLLNGGVKDPPIAASYVFDYLESNVVLPKMTTTINCGEIAHYQALRPLVSEVGKDYARVVGPIIFNTSVFPAVSLNNDVACVAGRINNTRNNVVPPAIFNKYANEFIELVSDCGVGTPLSISEVMAHQDKARQKLRSEKQSMWSKGKLFIKSFQKKESYQKVQDPRNISTCPTDHTLRLSRYTLAIKQQRLCDIDWFIPGSTPSEIITSIRKLCADYERIINCDFSRLDGTISRWLRERIMHAVLLRFFGDDQELLSLLTNERNASGVTAQGVRYNSGEGQKSGSPLTTVGNTLVTAFFFFATLREDGYDPTEAFDNIGLMYGDDAVNGRISKSSAEKVASCLGLSIKIEAVLRGQPLTYLGRTFIDPWSTDTSMQDIKRTLSKIHTSVTNSSEVSSKTALLWKCMSYLITDAKTPILHVYCEHMLKLLNVDRDTLDITCCPSACKRDLGWWVSQDFELSWYQGDEIELMEQIAAEHLSLSVEHLRRIEDNIRSLTSVEDKFPNVERDIPIQMTSVVGDNIHIVSNPTFEKTVENIIHRMVQPPPPRTASPPIPEIFSLFDSPQEANPVEPVVPVVEPDPPQAQESLPIAPISTIPKEKKKKKKRGG